MMKSKPQENDRPTKGHPLMQIKRIKPGEWYQTKQGEGKCLSTAGKHPKFLIDGKEVWLSSSEVQHEIAKGEEPPEKQEEKQTDPVGKAEPCEMEYVYSFPLEADLGTVL